MSVGQNISISRDSEIVTLCDDVNSDGTNVVEFLRRIRVDENNNAIITVDTTLDGSTAYTPQGTVSVCGDAAVHCVESQEWSYGIDNTGTDYRWDDATYQITLSDGSTLSWTQSSASNASWSAQLTEWAAGIQAAADAAGLAWFAEPRFIDNFNPSNIDGTINGPGGTPSGLPGAPSVPIAENLYAGGMRWRYVNVQICPGQPVPVAAELIEVADQGTGRTPPALPYSLVSSTAVLGPIQKFFVCRSCGDDPVWFLDDGVTLASAGQIPNCWDPCGTLTLAESPPDRECDFDFTDACDNNNQADVTLFTAGVTRRTSICNGVIESVDYFVADPMDPSALVPYTLVGQFVDCATGEELPDVDAPVCFTPSGKELCYGSEAVPVVYQNNDNNTDIDASQNATQIKWNLQAGQQAEADAVTQAIEDCINSGEVANITWTDANGTTVTFAADTIITPSNGGAQQALYQGTSSGSWSGKLSAAEVVCGDVGEVRVACLWTACQADGSGPEIQQWRDSVTGEVVDVSELYECVLGCTEICEDCPSDLVQQVVCADGNQAEADDGDQILLIAERDCEGNLVVSQAFNTTQGNAQIDAGTVVTEACDPQPEVETIRECIVDTAGRQWTQIQVVQADGSVGAAIFIAADTLTTGTPQGESSEWTACADRYVSFDNVRLCEIDAEFLLLVDYSGGQFAKYSFYDESITPVAIPVPSAGAGANIDEFLLYAISGTDLLVIDVNTNVLLSTIPMFTNDGSPLTSSAATYDNFNGRFLFYDYGPDSVYEVNVVTGEVSFFSGPWTGIAGSGSSMASNPVDGSLYVMGSSGRVYQISETAGSSGAATLVYDSPGNTANGSTFDADGNLYLTGGPNTYQVPPGFNPADEVQIIDDWGPAANSIAFYRVQAPVPTCFHRRFGVLADGSRELIGDYNVSDDSPRTVVGDIDCCECTCSGGSGSGGDSDDDVPVLTDILTELQSSQTWTSRVAEGSGTSPLVPVAGGSVRSFTVTADRGQVLVTLASGDVVTVRGRGSRTWTADTNDTLDGLPTSIVGTNNNAEFDVIWEEA